jgi:hypothetical protein
LVNSLLAYINVMALARDWLRARTYELKLEAVVVGCK